LNFRALLFAERFCVDLRNADDCDVEDCGVRRILNERKG